MYINLHVNTRFTQNWNNLLPVTTIHNKFNLPKSKFKIFVMFSTLEVAAKGPELKTRFLGMESLTNFAFDDLLVLRGGRYLRWIKQFPDLWVFLWDNYNLSPIPVWLFSPVKFCCNEILVLQLWLKVSLLILHGTGFLKILLMQWKNNLTR